MGRYVTQEAVLVRLRGKVKVTENPDQEPDRLPILLLTRLIAEAEGAVEMDLSPRYLAPFQTLGGGSFSQLPQSPTQMVIKTLCELLSAIRVLETDFGRGSSVDSSKYADSMQNRYNLMIFGNEEKKVPGLLTLRENTFNIFKLPPLPALRSNYQMAAVDTGFAGFIDRSDDFGFGSYPAMQINSPEENFWNGFINPEPQNFTSDR